MASSGGAGLRRFPSGTGGASTNQASQSNKTSTPNRGNSPAAKMNTGAPTVPGKGKGGGGGKKGGGGQKGGGGGGGLPNYGLNVNDPTAFNVYGMPKTQGAFNKMVLQNARTQYLPQQQAIQGQITGENSAFGARNTDISGIYANYQTEAQQAYDKLKGDLADIQSQVAAGSNPANLNAALQSSVTGQNSLAAMMGLPANAAPAPVDAAAAAATQRLSNAGQEAALGQAGNILANVGTGRTSALATEAQRHQGVIQGLNQQRTQLSAQIPGIIAKTRQDLINQLLSAQGQQFQQNLAQQQFGETVRSNKAGEKIQGQQLTETQKVDAANIEHQKTQDRIDQQNADTNAQQVQTAATDALAKTQGQAQRDAIMYLQSALVPPDSAYSSTDIIDQNQFLADGKTLNPNYGKKVGSRKVLTNPGNIHYDVGSILKTLITQYGIPKEQALQMMSSIGGRTNVTGQSGQTVAQWANSFDARAKSRSLGVPATGPAVTKPIQNKFKFGTPPKGGTKSASVPGKKMKNKPSSGRFS